MISRFLATAGLLGSLCITPLGAQQVFDLPQGSWANDVTPDGSIVVGTWSFGDGFIWDWATEPSPTVIVGGDVVGVSDDGSVVVGNWRDPSLGGIDTVAAIWTAGGGWQSLGWLPNAPCGNSLSTAYDISGDGTTAVGLSWDGCSARGFRWTQATGMQELQNLANGECRASTISGDGSVIAGFARGTFSRTPAYWGADTTGAVLNPEFQGEVSGTNEDGSRTVGTLAQGGLWYEAFVRDTATGVITNLGTLNNNWAAFATDISENGNVIVGYDYNGLAREAWVWTSTGGIISLNDRLTAMGITGTDEMFVCRAVSDDGSVIVGGGADGSGGPFGTGGFIVALGDTTWTNVGGSTLGINGRPQLSGVGNLVAGSTAALKVANAPESTPMLAWMSFTSVPLSVLGGTIHATPFVNQFLFNSNPTGNLTLSTSWPAGVPAGTDIWFQFIIADPSVPDGLTLSNGLMATTP